MKSYIRSVFLILFLLFLSATAAYPGTRPVLNHGQKWRIGYYEGGPYINYPAVLKKIIEGLVELGWVEPVTFPDFEDPTDAQALWHFLAQQARSDFIVFVDDACWSAQWSHEKRSQTTAEILKRLNGKKDIDFMIAAGTWAAQDLANTAHSTPTMAVSVSDAVKTGISASYEHSGLDHFHVKCDPDRYVRQIRLFHRLVKFKKLGVVFDNTVEGRSYAGFDEIMQAAKERNFEVVSCEVSTLENDLFETTNEIIKCHEKLCQKADAVYVTIHRGIDLARMKEIAAPFLASKIPTWSQRGKDEVKMGLLFCTAQADYTAVGRFHAGVMARALNGESLGTIDQIFRDPEFIAVNKKTADIIGYTIPPSILRIANEVYDRIDHE